MNLRLLPDSTAARTIAVMLVGLMLSHFASLGAYRMDLIDQFDSSVEHEMVERIVAARSAVQKATPEERERAAQLLSGAWLDVHWSRVPLVSEENLVDEHLASLRDALRRAIPDHPELPLRLVSAEEAEGAKHANQAIHFVLVSAQLPDGDWLNLKCVLVEPTPATPHGLLLSTGLMAFAILILSIILIRYSTSPLQTMARAAERLGVDVAAPPLPEVGPSEVRQAARAFNEMQRRIERLLSDRTQMFVALSHDLRTPLTVLRLRAEYIEDDDQHEKMLSDIADMEEMINAVLSFLRDDNKQEDTALADLAVTLATICDALNDAGGDAHYVGVSHLTVNCRPVTLRRAFMNLIDNAIKYGNGAQVCASVTARNVLVEIIDHGPGIPEAELDRVFQPFYRVERSRSRETGGYGLGLTIARSAIRSHGGDIVLSNRAEGGLRVTVLLPWIEC
ncbi:HAMP domain-containing protein [Azospirillum sp. B21]|uniref:ATP-binding protein n=1 Tax=unclassified Azospirillum TaxID=2630922 RepID=UPI0011EFA32F|nr:MULTISPECIES: ATP-binding protein [unclassified Azospirillum]KAA0576140.1 HAMP domain-containing protein [Azospirillum sp. B21]MDR6774766.1 signal transduction histidine kinase [Azospirillum sp. BE72]